MPAQCNRIRATSDRGSFYFTEDYNLSSQKIRIKGNKNKFLSRPHAEVSYVTK